MKVSADRCFISMWACALASMMAKTEPVFWAAIFATVAFGVADLVVKHRAQRSTKPL